MTSRTSLIALAAIGFAVLPSAALAAPAVALVGDKTLVSFDTETGAAGASVDVTGVDSLLGIDVRPADNALYGVAADGSVVTIDLATGAATVKSSLSEKLPAGVAASVDFNPAADRLRIVGSDGTNLRANVDDGMTTVDGQLNFDAADANAAATSSVVAVAYTNSVGKPEKTAMYDIDSKLGLLQQTTPNDGILATRGALGVTGTTYAFDIASTADLTNTAYLAAGGALHTVNLETGAATKTVDLAIEGDIRDIAILPVM
ncbi:hypothetical protein VW23_020320 [Devosia insulae DS-56]|uniref:DUF4394 domain-containing protein n=1 Tax=Devosia insulae DS-56 TaxID=1116389 RepID=A0A1E5XPX3_9HYPH|nr:DUF4394 domain-containing protein [Devosia insulae]OEO30619.1 hypothetical protein VW23_020320 [Devosia insulae DS-56]